MGKLHELIAVDADLQGAANRILKETIVTFTKRADHFLGFTRALEWFNAEVPKAPVESKHITTSVAKRLDYQKDFVIRHWDAELQRETTNMKAVGTIEVDGETFEAMPVTFLLGLEKKLIRLRAVYEEIPTLAPEIEWEKDQTMGDDVYTQTDPKQEYKTKKVITPFVLHKPTKEHPAQVRELEETVNVGMYTRRVWSGMLSPAEKSKLLGKIDKLIRAVKKARQRANSTEVVEVKVAEQLFNYIHS